MTESSQRNSRATRMAVVIIGVLVMVLGLLAVAISATAWILIPGGSMRSASLAVQSDECPVLVIEQPNIRVELTGSEWLQEFVGLKPEVEISSSGDVLVVPTKTLPDVVLGVTHCRLMDNDSWKVVTIPGMNQNLDTAPQSVIEVIKSSENVATFLPRDLNEYSLVIQDPGPMKIQGVLVAPWSRTDVQWVFGLGAALILAGTILVVIGLRVRSRGKHEADE